MPVSGDMVALRALIESVNPGDRVKATNHDYIHDSGMSTVDRVTGEVLYMRRDKPVSSQGRKFTTSYLAWPTEGSDFEVENRTLRIYNPSHSYVHGGRAKVLTLEFSGSEIR